MKRRLLSVLIALTLVLTMMPSMVWAASKSGLPFKAYVNGAQVLEQNISKTTDGYKYLPWDKTEPDVGDLYTLRIPEGSEIKLEFKDHCLAYLYSPQSDVAEDADYVEGAIDDYVTGITSVTYRTATPDGKPYHIQVQDTYNADWTGAALRYAVTFDFYDAAEESRKTISSKISASTIGEWEAIDLLRDGKSVPSSFFQSLGESIVKAGGNLETNAYNYTNNAKAILALTAGGYDAGNVDGINLIDKLKDYDKVEAQGANGPMYALLALDAGNYGTSEMKQHYIDDILNCRTSKNVWSYGYGSDADADLTGIAIMALAPHSEDPAVKSAIDTAVNWLSDNMNDDGTFSSWGSANSNSTATVIWGLCANGINPDEDERFVRDGKSAFDGMMSFALLNGGFGYTDNQKLNDLATQQCYEALIACNRLLQGKSSFYNMSDVGELRAISIKHSKKSYKAKSATYFEAGHAAGTKCTRCGKVLSGYKVYKKKTFKTKSLKAGKGYLKISWSKVSGAKKYYVRYSDVNDLTQAKSVSTTGTSRTIKKLKKGTTYYVWVKAANSKKQYTNWSAVRKIRVK